MQSSGILRIPSVRSDVYLTYCRLVFRLVTWLDMSLNRSRQFLYLLRRQSAGGSETLSSDMFDLWRRDRRRITRWF